ncbi:type IV pilus assembly protein PilA [Granulicella pectinivorans]|jgi:type IV pilus assembly protein PilA|uniref:Type IV pilus assembly protein PilA n=1 Tax=Granulicella pectinivorans TaxID=474950 RepID=A0A1I6MJB3_9BACT|nr:prepilin-type N-terminal cleavage/methylation domain-containing protein [Granulicella pectinivorans]SFS15742.1 type IV pilus assembly protein PilA [Granulicella pectinivorans]
MMTTMKTFEVARRQDRNDDGFTLIELLIVMSVMLILMTLGIPQLLKLRKTANETSAVASVKAIGAAELTYSSAYPANGFACTLAALGGVQGSGAPTPQSAQILPADLAAGQKAGYTFAITCGSKVTVNNQDMYNSFEVTAVPNSIGRSGDKGFCLDENNIIKVDPAGGTNCVQAQ